MDSVDLDVLRSTVSWLAEGRRVLMATVAATWGSAPRPPGAWLAIRDDGVPVGSVSGGCIEEDLIARVRRGEFAGRKPLPLTYGVTREEALRFGLPCGGTLRLVLEAEPDRAVLADLLARVERGETAARRVDLVTGRVILRAAGPGETFRVGDDALVAIHGPVRRLLIVGAGQISAHLARMAQALDYRVTVCDPREEYAAAWQVPGAELVSTMPDDTVLAMNLDGRSAVVALTHDPKLDDMALLEALKSPAFYVGALGSMKSNAKRRERLGQFDLSADEIARLRGPVGLAIGSRTPPEIAVAILAEMTAVKNGVPVPLRQAEPAAASAAQ
jgi:xanthine dehydrogenase accessory factor